MDRRRFGYLRIWQLLGREGLHVNIQPGKPTQNGFIDSFNGCLHDEYLNEHWFSDVSHARKTISEWRKDYND